MTTRRKQLGAGLAAVVTVGFGAYGLGTQAGDGDAVAARSSGGPAPGPVVFEGPGGPGRAAPLGRLAERLGVERSELEDALAAVRREHEREDPRADLAAALADALDLPQERVSEALEQVHSREHDEMRDQLATTLAAELGLSASRVRSALENVEPAGPPGPEGHRRVRGPRAFLRELAADLGVAPRRLREALEAATPEPSVRPGPGAPGGHLAELANALGVSEDELEQAMEEVRASMESRWEERHEEFVNAVAERLGIPAERVRDALPPPEVRPAPVPRGPHGP